MEETNKDLLIQKLLEQNSKVLSELKTVNSRLNELEALKNDIPTAEELLTDAGHMMRPKLSEEGAGAFSNKMFKPPKRKRGLGHKPLLESEIKEAQAKALSAAHAARLLNVSYKTYKKYARLYNIHTFFNQRGAGIMKVSNPNKGKYPLNEILEGKYPDYPIFRLKDKLIRAKVKPTHCEQCGYNERRVVDGKIPLLLVFEDGNSRNHKIENIKLLCYNCTFTSGKIWMKCKTRKKWLNDPDRILGSRSDIIQKY